MVVQAGCAIKRFYALRHGDWKIVGQKQRDQMTWELFNIANDMEETDNRSLKESNKVVELQRLWEHFNSQMREPLFGAR